MPKTSISLDPHWKTTEKKYLKCIRFGVTFCVSTKFVNLPKLPWKTRQTEGISDPSASICRIAGTTGTVPWPTLADFDNPMPSGDMKYLCLLFIHWDFQNGRFHDLYFKIEKIINIIPCVTQSTRVSSRLTKVERREVRTAWWNSYWIKKARRRLRLPDQKKIFRDQKNYIGRDQPQIFSGSNKKNTLHENSTGSVSLR